MSPHLAHISQQNLRASTLQTAFQSHPVAYAENFHGGVLVHCRMVAICIWCALFATSQFDVICMFPIQRFGEVC